MNRILHVVGIRWWSAIAAHAIDVATAQRRAGKDVRVAVLADSPAERELRRRGVEPALRFGGRPWDQLALGRGIARLVRDGATDVVHVHTGVGHAAAEVGRRRDDASRPLVRTRGDIRPPRRTPGNRFLYARADAVVVPGAFQRPGLLAMGVPADRTHVVLGPVDTTHFSPEAMPPTRQARASLDLPGEAVIIGHVARLSPVKGHDVSIRALAALGATRDVHLLISGEEFQTKRVALEALARTHGVENRVHFRKRWPDVREVIAAIDVGVVASTGSEAMCRVAGELMACGRPLVASRVGVLPEMVVDGVTAESFPPGDVPALAACLKRVIEDPARAKHMAARAVQASAAWSFPAVVSAYDAVYAAARVRHEGRRR